MIEILILSLVQGITEFLPVSSSSHLIIFSEFTNFKNQNLSIDVSLHIGSFIAVITYFYKDIFNFIGNKDLFIKIFISSIHVIVFGVIYLKLILLKKLEILK